MEIADLINKVRTKYASCRSYSDSGTLCIPTEENSEVRFSTAFIRPDHFRLEWRGWHPYFGPEGKEEVSVLWCNRRGTFGAYHYHDGKVEKEPSLQKAADRVAGTSHRLAPIIYQLLFGTRDRWLPWIDASQMSDDSIADQLAFRLVSPANKDEQFTEAWIDARDHRLMQIVQHCVITARFQKLADLYLLAKDPELYEQSRAAIEPEPKERRYSQVTRYGEVHFDEDIDESIFYPQ